MLSILIPIYNFSCFDLARELSAQASAANVPFEIICIDDASCFYKKENRAIRDLPHTVYIELIENIGRSRIRNLLVSKAQYDILLFLDCDSKIANSDYIKRYLEEFRRADILSGGTLYEPCPPTDLNYALHWTFGSKRESPPDENQRKTFTSNNFIIKKTIIEKYPFNEKIIRYGHEDSLFQMELEKHGLTIRFIRNPVIHIGLETNSRFIDKTQESVRNLYDLYASGVFNNMDIGKIRLLKTYILLRKWKADGLVNQLFPVMNWLNRKTNANGRPNLRVFDLYKLTFLTHIARSYSQIQQNQ